MSCGLVEVSDSSPLKKQKTGRARRNRRTGQNSSSRAPSKLARWLTQLVCDSKPAHNLKGELT